MATKRTPDEGPPVPATVARLAQLCECSVKLQTNTKKQLWYKESRKRERDGERERKLFERKKDRRDEDPGNVYIECPLRKNSRGCVLTEGGVVSTKLTVMI